jgi:hypothetical protein
VCKYINLILVAVGGHNVGDTVEASIKLLPAHKVDVSDQHSFE